MDEVVKAKLLEFQTQLDAAESEFLEELKTRHQIIAECAAKKIKDVIDKFVQFLKLLYKIYKYIQIYLLKHILYKIEYFSDIA